MDQTLAVLKNLDVPLTTVWIIAIFSVSDPQIRVLLPTIIKKSIDAQWSDDRWEKLQPTQRRAESLELLKGFLDRQLDYPKERVVVGLLDCFRADYDHVLAAVGTAVSCGVENFRLVDTAGSAFVEQVHHLVGALVTKYPQCRFFGHFHNDFGLATATALAGLSEGLAGVDVSVGGFANRAGHAPVAEVAMALRSIYGVTLEGFHYDLLTKLSRTTEQVYGLMESPTQPITGVITHGVLSGIRTQLIDKEPRIFDEIEPEEVGGHLDRVFGVRSGRDGMLRYLQDHAAEVRKLGFTANSETADELLDELTIVWSQRSEKSIAAIRALIGDYHRLLRAAAFTESEMLDWLSAHSRNQAAE